MKSLESFAPAEHSILVVDDTSANRRLYGALLKKNGFEVRTAEDGVEALKLIEEELPSLVLLDYMMPNMDGIEVLQSLRAAKKTERLPVVMLTASAEPDHIDAALGAGANDYITKPVNGRLLVTRIKGMITASAARERASISKRANALLEELEDAARVQQAQLPSVPHKWKDWRITGAVAPSGQIGGDLFNFVETEDGRFIAFLLDVSGHGTASALVAAETSAEFRHLISRRGFADSVARLNDHLARRASGKYCCLAAVEISDERVRIINAGLPPIVVLRGSKVQREIWGSGTPIGMFEESTYEITEMRVDGGDQILLLSDGLTEPFGATDDSAGAVQRLALWPSVTDEIPSPEALRSRIRSVTRESAPELLDDATVLLLRMSSTVQESLRLLARPEAIPRAVRWVVDQSPEWADPAAVDHGLTEALTNAILHGSLGLSSEMRSDGGYDEYLHLAQELPERPGFTDRHVELRVVKNPEAFGIRISWEGCPCPVEDREPQSIRGDSLAALKNSGMGMNIIRSLFDRVEWDDSGLGMEIWMQKELAGRDRTLPPPV